MAGASPWPEVEELFRELIPRTSAARPGLALETVERVCSIFGESRGPLSPWASSGLNIDGCPIEIGLSTADRSLRYTVEMSGPECPMEQRLDRAFALAEDLGHDVGGQEQRARWAAMQHGDALRWGASVGVRQQESERLKLYLEVPGGGGTTAGSCIRENVEAAKKFHHGSRLVMVGADFEGDREEFYFRLPSLDRAEVGPLLRSLHRCPQTAPLMPLLQRLMVLPLETALQWASLGYSVCLRGGAEPQISLFVRSTAAGQTSVAECFRALAAETAEGSLYEDLLGAASDKRLPDHGVVSLAMRRGRLEMRVGVSAAALARAGALRSCLG